MRIIEEGRQNRVLCPCCESLLEFDAAEIVATDKTMAASFLVKCMKCGFDINVNPAEKVRTKIAARLK